MEKAKNERCPTCGEPVDSIFDHVDRNAMCETPEQTIERLEKASAELLAFAKAYRDSLRHLRESDLDEIQMDLLKLADAAISKAEGK